MAKVKVQLTEQTFIGGVLRPEGYLVEVDEVEMGAKVGATTLPSQLAAGEQAVALTPNLVKVGRGGADEAIPYVVAAIAPTGPAPTAPQATPPGTIEATAGAFAAPAEPDADGSGVAVIGEGSAAAMPAKPGK